MRKGKWFELTGARINEVKISSKALQGECILLRISGDFELSEFELSGSNCNAVSQHLKIKFLTTVNNKVVPS